MPANFTTRGNLSERFDRQAKKTPNAIAVSDGRTSLTYRELARRSHAAARWLAREGVGAESVVALLAERGPDLLAIMIAVQRAGAAFLNLDPDQPLGRLSTILGSSCARLLLTGPAQAPMVGALLEPLVERIHVAELEDALAPAATKPARAARRAASHLAYLIYTSGSSGAPKGVMIEQRGLSNHLASLISELKLSAKDVIAQTAPQSFVISVWQFLAAPMVGARVHVCGDGRCMTRSLLVDEISREGITVLEIVPSLLREVLGRMDDRTVHRALGGLRLLISTGEPLPPDLCRDWFAALFAVPMINAYGAPGRSDDVALHRLIAAPAVDDDQRCRSARHLRIRSFMCSIPTSSRCRSASPGSSVSAASASAAAMSTIPRRTRSASCPTRSRARPARACTGPATWPAAAPTALWSASAAPTTRSSSAASGSSSKEIEPSLADHPAVQRRHVEPRREVGGEVQLIARIVPRAEEPESASELSDFLRRPDFRPTRSRRAIPVPDRCAARFPWQARPLRVANDRPQDIMRTDADRSGATLHRKSALRHLDRSALSSSSIGVTDNFFDLGGHSLLAGQVLVARRPALGVSLPIQDPLRGERRFEAARPRLDEAAAAKPQQAVPRLTAVTW